MVVHRVLVTGPESLRNIQMIQQSLDSVLSQLSGSVELHVTSRTGVNQQFIHYARQRRLTLRTHSPETTVLGPEGERLYLGGVLLQVGYVITFWDGRCQTTHRITELAQARRMAVQTFYLDNPDGRMTA